jgi:hypothetical protein
VIGEDEIGGEAAERLDVGVDVRGALGCRQVLEQPRLEPRVPVEQECRQQTAR